MDQTRLPQARPGQVPPARGVLGNPGPGASLQDSAVPPPSPHVTTARKAGDANFAVTEATGHGHFPDATNSGEATIFGNHHVQFKWRGDLSF